MRLYSPLIILCITLATLRAEAQINDVPLREADVMWSRRVWREIDLRQKINQPLYYPLEASQGYASLYTVIMEGIKAEKLTAYSTGPFGQDDAFTDPLSTNEISDITTSVDSVYTPDLLTGNPVLSVQVDSVRAADITRYRIKEDWVFDKQHSKMRVNIIGIAPMEEVFGEDGESRGFRTLFWVYYPEARYHLIQFPVFLRHNDRKDITYADLFDKRFFDARIVKASNVYDRDIGTYATGVDALLEAEEEAEEIFEIEHDVWDY